MSDAVPLPPRPSLEHYRKLAKDLQKACRRGEEPDWRLTFRIDAGAGAVGRLWAEIRKRPGCRLTDAQWFVARAHGFPSWPKFAKHIEELQRADSEIARFEAAADAIAGGDLQTLKRLLQENPELVRARSAREHRSTLLHYVSANGIEDFRQQTPANIVAMATLLLDAGADVNAESDAYGGHSTALNLTATSVHPERAGVQEALMQLLLDRGATIEVAGSRHSAVRACLYNGRGKAARFLAGRGARLHLDSAAGAGRLDAVRDHLDENNGQLQRGFLWACQYGYEDVVGFLLEHGAGIRDAGDTGATGLHWAAGGGHVGIIRLLLERGAPLETRNAWDGTVLEHAGWAFVNGDPAIDFVPVFEILLAGGARIADGWLGWLEGQKGRPEEARARLAAVLRRYGAKT